MGWTPGRIILPVALAATILQASAAVVYSLLPNGSFELDVNQDEHPDGWVPALFRSPATATWDRTVAHTGRASVRIADSAHADDPAWDANTGRWVLNQRLEVAPGQELALDGWIRTELTGGYATLVLAWFASGRWLKEDASPRVSGVTDWTHCRLQVAAPPGATEVSVYLILGSAVGSAWFDDVALSARHEAASDYRPIDLSPWANAGFRDDAAGNGQGGWTDQGPNDARNLPTGQQVFRGIPFQIAAAEANAGRGAIVLGSKRLPQRPDRVRLGLERRFDTLHLLLGAAWAGRDGSRVGEAVLHYANGASASLPLRNGHEVVDWWQPRDTDASVAGWIGSNAESARVGLNILPWQHPHPEIPVVALELAVHGDGPVLMLAAATTSAGSAVFERLPPDYRVTDRTGWYPWTFASNQAAMGELDLSGLLDAPAGKHGFVSVNAAGQMVFGNGARARFFGTNVGGRRCCPSREEAETMAARLAAHGFNLLRLHAPDGRYSPLIDYGQGNSRRLNPEALDRYDFFVAELKKRGIYVYFDLLDYRAFQPGDGVRDAADMDVRWENSIKGASIFNARMIDLQKEFAEQLLTHRNPYTGLRYVDEPALILQEITNENSLFYLHNQRLMLPSYVAELSGLWNAWLLQRFGSRAALAAAWTNPAGECAILPDEDPAAGTVRFPTAYLYADLANAPFVGDKSPPRLNAMTRFLYERQLVYYDTMTAHLRSLGLRCPITGTNQDFSDASNAANARCEVMTRNNYWCHPNMNARPHIRFRNLAMVSADIPTAATPIANVASSSVVGKPMLVPEFNFPWPNAWRAECLPLMTAYACLQDWDGLLFFAYDPSRADLTSFGNASDPVRWGQVQMAALMFHRQDVAVARNTVHVGVSEVDRFATRPQRTSDRYSPYRILPYISKVRNAYFDTRYTGDADVVFASGHSAHGDYSQAHRAVVFADAPQVDEAGLQRDRGWSARQTVPGLRTRAGTGKWDTEVDPQTVPPGARLVERDGRPVGFADGRRVVFPCASMDGTPEWLHRLTLEAFAAWNLPGVAPGAEAGKVFRSDTGELVLDASRGLFTAATPRSVTAVGFLFAAGAVAVGDVTLTCRTPFAAIGAVSLDREDLRAARRILVTAVARAENTGQAHLLDEGPPAGGVDADTGARLPQAGASLAEAGRAPVLAEPVDADLRLAVAGGSWRAWALSPTGAKERDLAVQIDGQGLSLNTAPARSPWILLER